MYRIDDDFKSLRLPYWDNPEDLHWYVVQTHSCEEARSIDRLEELGFGAFCPIEVRMIHPRRVRRDRMSKKEVRRPLFIRYVFVGFDKAAPQEWLRVNEIETLIGPVSMNARPLRIPSEIIDQLHDAERDGDFARLEPDEFIHFQIGDKVVLSGGAFGNLPAHVTALPHGQKGEAVIELHSDAMLGKPVITVPFHLLQKQNDLESA